MRRRNRACDLGRRALGVLMVTPAAEIGAVGTGRRVTNPLPLPPGTRCRAGDGRTLRRRVEILRGSAQTAGRLWRTCYGQFRRHGHRRLVSGAMATSGRDGGRPVRPDRHQAFAGDVGADLTRREFELIQLLAGHEGPPEPAVADEIAAAAGAAPALAGA
jgi:hypothetical protein